MSEESKVTKDEPTSESTGKSRREFVKTSAQVAVTAPAVALLLSATTKPASAAVTAYQASASHILDDFTSGNDHEDIDAIVEGSNTAPNNLPEKDDTFTPR